MKSSLLILAATLSLPATSLAEPTSIRGQAREVTLYETTAIVSREITVPNDLKGEIEILVTGLPSAIDPQSVYADRSEGIELRALAVREERPNDGEQQESKIASLDQQIESLNRQIATARNEIALRRIRQKFLRRLGEDFVAPAAQREMTHGVLQAGELEKLTRMHFSEYETASQEILKFDNEIKEKSKELTEIRSERSKLAEGPARTYEALLYLNRKAGGRGKLMLTYLVRDCGWTPFYNVRAASETGKVDIEFNALVQQASGESWENVTLALSTAVPTASAYNPQLLPLYVRVGDRSNLQQQAIGKKEILRRNLSAKSKAVAKQQRTISREDNEFANFAVNDSAANVQLLELSERHDVFKTLYAEGVEEDVSVLYAIERPVTIESRRDPNLVPVFEVKADARFYHVAAPVLTTGVFRETEVTNRCGRDLLGGNVQVFLDGEFTGRTDIPTIANGQSFTLGLGVDSQLRVRRSLDDRRESVQGGNRLVEIACDIIIDNFKEKPVNLLVRERTPFSGDANTLRVRLGDTSEALSSSDEYLRFEKPKGILRWDLEIPPGFGAKAKVLQYGYTLEFDKNMTLQDAAQEAKRRAGQEYLRQKR